MINTVKLTTMQMQDAYNRFANIAGADNGHLFWTFITNGGKHHYQHTANTWALPMKAHDKIQMLMSAHATAIIKVYKIRTPGLAWKP
jgi:hypothetical protein